ncbi:MAG: DUF1684 domain-containing protein [Gammaproteobacteria bacterium]|nr:DUF1684 domain-containing protein [Gammaproteobacteria bacterium]
MNWIGGLLLTRFIPSCLLVVLLGCSFFTYPLLADINVVPKVHRENHNEAIEAWRASRHQRLMRPDGWLTLVGLEWLKEGENRIGSAVDSDIQLSGGPAYWGSVVLENDKLLFTGSGDENVVINGELLPQSELVPDTEGKATVVSSGNLAFHVIFRESYGLRVKDSQAKALQNFTAVDNYAIDESWRIEGRFIHAEEGATLEIANVLGQISESPVYGTFEFEMDGRTHRLLGLGNVDSKDLWFIFADRTSGHGTYGAGRFLYSDGMPENDWLTVDFNKAYNPPCAFNPYSTCPLPPQENRLDLAVVAGEKDFHPDPG